MSPGRTFLFIINDDSKSMFMTLGNSGYEMIVNMLHVPIYVKNKTFNTLEIRPGHTETYWLDNRMVYDILDQICKDKDLYLYARKFKASHDRNGACYVFHSSLMAS